jgi:hypothetical protein
MEQPRLEGIVDYTELAEASMQIQAITVKAIKESQKQIEIKGVSIVEQIVEYINETIKPIIETGIWESSQFTSHAKIYTSHFQINFGNYIANGKSRQAQLFGCNGRMRVYFSQDENPYIENATGEVMIRLLAEEWARLKDSMHRMIPYAIEECNKANAKALEKQKEMSDVINNFRL